MPLTTSLGQLKSQCERYGRRRRRRPSTLQHRSLGGDDSPDVRGGAVELVARETRWSPVPGHRSRSQSVDIARQRGYGWITGPSGGAWAPGISPVWALSLPESVVTVTPNAAKAAADAAAESSALMRAHRPG